MCQWLGEMAFTKACGSGILEPSDTTMKDHQSIAPDPALPGERRKPTPGAIRDAAIARAILGIPAGFVSSYGKIAAAAGYPGYHRQVAQLLSREGEHLPWQRVVGSNGELKTQFHSGDYQRRLLEAEGVRFQGERVDMDRFQYIFPEVTWDGTR